MSQRWFFEHQLDGDIDTWIVFDEHRGRLDPIARCYSPADAMALTDMLNASEAMR